jgi:hypothetical protein
MLFTRVKGKDERMSARVRLSFRGEQAGRGGRERKIEGEKKGGKKSGVV